MGSQIVAGASKTPGFCFAIYDPEGIAQSSSIFLPRMTGHVTLTLVQNRQKYRFGQQNV